MPIYIYTQDQSDERFQKAINDQVPDTVSSVDPGELNAVSIDVAATSKADLDYFMEEQGFSFLHEASVVIEGTHHWGSFTTANEPTSSLTAGDTGFNTDLNSQVWYDGAAWTNDVKTSSIEAPAVLRIESLTNNVNIFSNFEIELTSNNGDIVNTTPNGTFKVLSDGIIDLANTADQGARIRKDATGTDITPMLTLDHSTGTNPGTSAIHVGDRDPSGVITSTGGGLYIVDDGVDSSMHINITAAGSGTDWQQFGDSIVAPTSIEIETAADLDALASVGVITFSQTTTLVIQGPITTPNRFVIDGGTLKFFASDFSATLTYSGTDTFISGTGGIRTEATDLVASSTGTLFDMTNPTGINNRAVNLRGTALVGWTSMGSIEDFAALVLANVGFASVIDGIDLINTNIQTSGVGFIGAAPSNLGAFFRFTGTSALSLDMTLIQAALPSGAKILRIDPAIGADSSISISNNSILSGELFDVTGGTTGTFTAVADAVVSAESITSVTDSSGVARFNFTAPPTLFVNQEVVISTFITNTSYNGTFLITATGANFFEVSSIAFGSDETGSFLSNSITLTETSTTLIDGDTIVIKTDMATDYDGGAIVYNQITNSFQINRTFTTTHTGVWDTSGIDQTDPRVLAANNPGFIDSKYIATAFVNDNVEANGAIVNNTFTDMVFGTGGSALIEGSNIERWKLIDELNGTFEYTGNEPFDGYITFDFTFLSSGGSQDFRNKWLRDVGAGFVDLPDDVESLVNVGSDAQSITKTFPLMAVKGDQIKPQITREAGSSGITTAYATIFSTQ